jgi:hypothetical protein
MREEEEEVMSDAESRGYGSSADRKSLRIVPETLRSALCSAILVQLLPTRDGRL